MPRQEVKRSIFVRTAELWFIGLKVTSACNKLCLIVLINPF